MFFKMISKEHIFTRNPNKWTAQFRDKADLYLNATSSKS